LIIQIPCLNEEATLPAVIRDLPDAVEGFDVVETLVVDDGSTDRTVAVAKECGVHHVASLPGNKGLARAFSSGLEVALRLGADVVVNTDGDNQYRGDDVVKLTRPILDGRADIVIGDRDTKSIGHFSWTKKRLQSLGSLVVRRFSGTRVPDATSGFRAITREAALHLNILSPFTYTLESIIQGGTKGFRIESVPIRTNEKTRESRLMKSTAGFVLRSASTILRISALYKPFRFFCGLGVAALLGGTLLGLRFLWFFLHGDGDGHVQSLILAAVLLLMGFVTIVLAVLADLVAVNRRLSEDVLYRLRRMELDSGDGPAHEVRGVRVWSRGKPGQ
ncbi:MAG: glycosyltransferase family 2 protein, partial [Planctomycetota bacterium]